MSRIVFIDAVFLERCTVCDEAVADTDTAEYTRCCGHRVHSNCVVEYGACPTCKTPCVSPVEPEEPDMTCICCSEEMDIPSKNPDCMYMQCCKQLIHWACLAEWFKSARTCPWCRTVQRDLPKVTRQKVDQCNGDDDALGELEADAELDVWEWDADRAEDRDYEPHRRSVAQTIPTRTYRLRLTRQRMVHVGNGNIYY